MTGVLHDTAILAAPTYRTRAYAQALQAAEIKPARAYILPGDEPHWDGPATLNLDLRGEGQTTHFRITEPAIETLESMGVECVAFSSADINATETINALLATPEEVFIYSGKGGALLRQPVLNIRKRFLHIHGGWVPEFLGSTAFYFSLLEEGLMGASAIWLNEGIDTGAVIRRRKYQAAYGVDIDCLVDPLVRADLLVEVLSERLADGKFPDGDQISGEHTTFQVIHPVLKHIAMRRYGLTL